MNIGLFATVHYEVVGGLITRSHVRCEVVVHTLTFTVMDCCHAVEREYWDGSVICSIAKNHALKLRK